MSLSPLELLPAELLRLIFFLSDLNLSLVDASPYIAVKLADNYIYNAVCTIYLTTTNILSPRSEQSYAQTRIFASQWMTWPYFQSWVLKTWENNGCLCGKTKDTGCFDKQWPPDFEDATRMLFTRSHLPVLACVKGRLPIKLLHGPWTADKTQFLRFLLWITPMSVDWEDERCRRLALEGRREAVLRGNLEVVELFNHNRRLGKAPNVEMVRFAVFEGGCDRSIVYDTMAAARIWNLRGDAWKDEELDNWCEERIKNGDPKGLWLKLKLEELMTTKIAGEDNTITADGVKVIPGQMHPNTGNYDDVAGDKLVVRSLKWNQVSFAISLILGRRLREHIRFLFLGPELATIWVRGVLIHRNYAPLRGPATIPVSVA
jgi:hypothetical protein